MDLWQINSPNEQMIEALLNTVWLQGFKRKKIFVFGIKLIYLQLRKAGLLCVADD